MKHILIIAVCLVGASLAASIPESSEERESGENGWYVPTKEGTFEWIDRETYEAQVKPEAEETVSQQQMGRIDLNAVDFHLFTRENEEKSQEITDSYKSISKSHFNASNPTKIIIHGWWQSDNADLNEEIKAVWLKKSANNVIAVRWARAHGEYVLAVAALPEVGRKIANLVDYLVNQFNMSLGDLEVIGHSLGSHVAAFVAKQVKSGQIYKIVGLDPAMPLFSYDKTDNRLCSDDALYVETIQTNGGLLGFKHPIGKATFYPNGGKKQPGCFLDLAGMCSHARSVAYYVESVEKNNFPAVKCDTYKNALKKGCGSTYSSVRMNSHSNFVSASGQYYVPVNSKSPYGKGE